MPTSERARTAWPAVLTATLCGIVAAMNVGKLPIALPVLRSEFHLSLTEAGWLAAAFSTLAMIFGMLIGVVADRIGAMRFCLFGLAASIGGGLLGLAGTSAELILVSRLVEGVGFISVSVSGAALVTAASATSQRRITLGIWSTYVPAGASLATLLAPMMIAQGGWRALWWLVLGLLAIMITALVIQRNEYSAAVSRRHAGMADVRGALHQPAPWLLALAFTAYATQFFAVVIWLPTFLQEQRAMTPGLIALLSAFVIASNVPGNLAGGALLHRHVNRGRLIAGASFIMGLAGFGIFSEGMPDLLRYLCCLLLIGVGGTIPTAVLSSPLVLASTPQQIGTLQGLYLQGSNLGQFAGIPLIAAVVTATGHWSAALYVTASASAVGILLGLVIARSSK
ncbi:MAG: MFS transporter [Zoogloeaceae bacterium]|jgi:MFS family permease|nr:MFS transporter [Zoogloeaceae bacterium]